MPPSPLEDGYHQAKDTTSQTALEKNPFTDELGIGA